MNDSNFLRQKAYTVIQAKILNGELRAGSVVSELALAHEIGISRTPVREAIGQLQLEGLFTKIHRVGTILRIPSQQELKELYEVREALESYAVGIATDSLSLVELEMLDNLINDMREIEWDLKNRKFTSSSESCLGRFFNNDLEFHGTIIRAAGNSKVSDIINEFRVVQRVYEYDRMPHLLPVIQGVIKEHHDIVEALRTRNREAARIATSAHIKASQRNALNSFAEFADLLSDPHACLE